LVSSVILGAETPINIRKDCLVFKVFSSEDAAAYVLSLLALRWGCSEKRGLSALCTNLNQKHGFFDILRVKGIGHWERFLLPFFDTNIRPLYRSGSFYSGLILGCFFGLGIYRNCFGFLNFRLNKYKKGECEICTM
jgi:hypothetical protein